VDDGRAANEQDLPAFLARGDHALGDGGNGQFLRAFGGDLARHEPEHRHRILARRGHDLHGCLVHEHAIALAHLVHRHGHRVRAVGRVPEDDAAVHFDLFDGEPLALVTNLALEVRRRVEVVGEHAVGRGGHPLGVDCEGRGAVLADLLQDVVQGVHVRRAHHDLCVARRLARGADLERGDLVVPAVHQDEVEDLRERARIDDVPVEVHRFRQHDRRSYVTLHFALPTSHFRID
jgi:hypothetical protein